MAKKFSKAVLSRQINGDLPTDEIAENQSDKQRVDQALAFSYPNYSRATLKRFILDGRVSVNGTIIKKASTLIDASVTPKLSLPESKTAKRPPVIYEDENVIVFDKPTGLLSVTKGNASPEPSLEDFGLIVHRLDRATSGVIILAKNPESKRYLQKQFERRRAHKSYFAIVCGHPVPEEAIINVPLTRNLKQPTTFMVSKEGREAITEYRTLDKTEKLTLLELRPKTGRTHQLRVHLAHLGTPILGDPVYNPRGMKAPRLFLHASTLEISIPGGKRLTFSAPLPVIFRETLKK